MDAVIRPVLTCLIMMFSCFRLLSADRIRTHQEDPVPTVGVALPGRMVSSLGGDFKR
jgi:hypothetical protein